MQLHLQLFRRLRALYLAIPKAPKGGAASVRHRRAPRPRRPACDFIKTRAGGPASERGDHRDEEGDGDDGDHHGGDHRPGRIAR